MALAKGRSRRVCLAHDPLQTLALLQRLVKLVLYLSPPRSFVNRLVLEGFDLIQGEQRRE